VGHGTAPGTPIPGKGMVLGQRIKKDNGARDPVSSVGGGCLTSYKLHWRVLHDR
jgi:hypothetical protein